MTEFIIASGNTHKVEELTKLLDSKNIKIKQFTEKIDVLEDGSNYQDNALLKAEKYYQKFKTSVISDDSGLEVGSLPSELGIHSARFGGENLSSVERYNLLLTKLEKIEDRTACFICTLCFYISPDEIYFFEGRLDGSIALKAEGKDGFGYDPVFIPVKSTDTLANMGEWKEKNSHRAVAAQRAVEFFARSRN